MENQFELPLDAMKYKFTSAEEQAKAHTGQYGIKFATMMVAYAILYLAKVIKEKG